MRPGLALILAAALAAAEDDAELARTVEELVKLLGSPSTEVRTFARDRLAAYGDRIRPLLESVDSPDPEVRRSIRALTYTPGRVEMELLPLPEGPLPVGAPLALDIRILNNTEETVVLLPDAARQGSLSPFRVRVGRTVVRVAFQDVNWGAGETTTILPGASRRLRLTLPRGTAALRRPALHDVCVVFDGLVGRGQGTTFEDALDRREVLESGSVKVHVLGRKAEEIEEALRSEDARVRDAAFAELSVREDDAVVPLLRRHALERPVRLAAVQKLGAVGAAEDFKLIYEATRDEDLDVRRAAVLGLAKYRGFKARSRLIRLSADPDLQAQAIRALQGHMHHATVECFIGLLQPGKAARENVDEIRRTIRDWTGISVDQRPSEIAEFRRWWEMNREQWAREHKVTDR